MEDKLVELYEREDIFIAFGNSRLTISKLEGTVQGYFNGVFIECSLLGEHVDGFYLDEKEDPPILYLNWHKRKGGKEQILVGRVGDIQKANEWVNNVNSLYKQRQS